MAYETAPRKEKKKENSRVRKWKLLRWDCCRSGVSIFLFFPFFSYHNLQNIGEKKRVYIHLRSHAAFYTHSTLPYRTEHSPKSVSTGFFFFGNSFPRLSQIIGSTGTSGDTSRSAFKMRWSRKETPCKERKTRVLGVYIYTEPFYTAGDF